MGKPLGPCTLLLIVVAALGAVAAPEAADASSFTPTSSVRLCANTGTQLQITCGSETLSSGANADLTTGVTLSPSDLGPAAVVTLLPKDARVPGPETNGWCAPGNAVDDDGDGTVNDGCMAYEYSETVCTGSADNDGDGFVNDGCPSIGEPIRGSVAGKAYSASDLGLINSVCGDISVPAFPLMASNTANAYTDETYPSPPGASGPGGPMAPLRDDGNGNSLPRYVDRYPGFLNVYLDPDRVDLNGDGDHFDSGENPGADFDHWYGSVTPVRPLARYAGSIVVAGRAVLLQQLVFNPGAFSAFQPPHPLSDLGAQDLGYPVLTVVQDPVAPPGPDTITDACSPIEYRSVLWGLTRNNPCTGGSSCGTTADINGLPGLVDSGSGSCSGTNEAGCVRYSNPATSGTHLFRVFTQSQRDLDGDGYENAFDTCPYATNVQNPRTSSGPDGDMLDSACDPSPSTNTGAGNHDGDTLYGEAWLNAQDNCPAVANSDQKESERLQPYSVAAPRGGSRADSIGDACDLAERGGNCGNTADDDGDTLVNDGCPKVGTFREYGCFGAVDDPDEDAATLGFQDDDTTVNDGCPSSASVANGHFHTVVTTVAKCIGGTDSDGDGWCAASGGAMPNDPNDSNASRTPEAYSITWAFPVASSGSGDGAPASGEPKQACNDGVDNDGDTLTDWLDSGAGACRPPDPLTYAVQDTDGDGFSDETEAYVGTDALGRCEVGAQGPPTPGASSDWPADLGDGSGTSRDQINITDLAMYVTGGYPLNTSPGDPGFDRRFDVRPGPGALTNWISTLDLAILTTFEPPMFGVKAYNYVGTDCTAHPVFGD